MVQGIALNQINVVKRGGTKLRFGGSVTEAENEVGGTLSCRGRGAEEKL